MFGSLGGCTQYTRLIIDTCCKVILFVLQAEEMAQTFRQRIAEAEAIARADILKFQPEVYVSFYSHSYEFAKSTNQLLCSLESI